MTRNLIVLTLVSLTQDAASELLYPLIPLLITVVLGAPPVVLGLIESAGTSSWHVGQGPNPQSKKAWEAQGYRYNHVASQFTQERLKQADLVLAMDQENFRNIMSLSSEQDDSRKIFLMRDFEMGAEEGSEVPDPYSLPDDAFEHVREMLENAIDGLIRNLTE